MFSVGPTFFSSPSGGGGDPLFAFVRALYHMDVLDGAIAFPDAVSGMPPATGQGSVKPYGTTSEFKFPTASAQFFNNPFATGRYGEEGWISIPDNGGSNSFGTGDFCMEGWFYPKYQNGIAMFTETNQTIWFLWVNTSGYLEWHSPAGTITSSGQLLLDQWNYVALDRNSGTVRLYINGSLVGSGTDNASINCSGLMGLGRSNGGAFYNWYGFIDEIRVTAASRYTASLIAVPTEPFPNF